MRILTRYPDSFCDKILFEMRSFVTLTFLALSSFASAEAKPNILFILIDDFGWMDVGYNGSTFYETPRIDAFAEEWMRFDACYTPSPMCSPTRLSILTGKNPARHGVTQWLPGRDSENPRYVRQGEEPRVFCPRPQSAGIEESEAALGEAFREAGYDTAFYGKWHMGGLKATGGPRNHGYDSEVAIIESNRCSMFYPFKNPNYFPKAKEGDNFTDLLTDAAIDFISKERNRPFYLHLCHFAMHSPIESKEELREHFEAKAESLPQMAEVGILDDYAHEPQKLRQDDAEYAGELATLDANVGRVVDALKASGLYDNTIIILTGDNGGRTSWFQDHPTSNQPLRTGKTFLFEGGLLTPLLIHWPRHSQRGVRTSVPVTSMDFYPTLLDMVGLEPKPHQHLDGVSLVPLFEGGEIPERDLIWHFPHYQGEGSYPASAIRRGDFKLIHNYHHDALLLYDIATDPAEVADLAEAMPLLVKKMDNALKRFLSDCEATIPTAIEEGRD
ncbi:MAG: sulfatase [Verrucomicrobiota bacterium]